MAMFYRIPTLLACTLIFLQSSLVKSEQKYQCKDHQITLPPEKVTQMQKCGETIGVKSMEEMTPEKIPCFAKCIMEGSELLDAKGKPHKENILKELDGMDEKVKETYKKVVEKCIDDHGDHISPNDQTCLSYGPLSMCVTAAFKSICQG